MTKEEARLLYLDYLYGEIDAETENNLMRFLELHPALREELKGLGETRKILEYLPMQEPENRIILIPAQENASKSGSVAQQLLEAFIPKSVFARTSFGIAAVLLVFFFAASLTHLRITTGAGGVNIAFGKQPAVIQPGEQPAGITAEQLQTVVNQIRRDNAELVAQAVQEVQKQQNYQLQQSLIDFATYVDEQRKSDIILFNSGLEGLHKSTQQQFLQTDRFLAELVRTISTNK